jgi:hypothetical protein
MLLILSSKSGKANNHDFKETVFIYALYIEYIEMAKQDKDFESIRNDDRYKKLIVVL